MSIYTKKGDLGITSTLKARLSKDSLLIETLGTLDEIVSFLDLAINFSQKKSVNILLKKVQADLSEISSILAGKKMVFSEEKVRWLETSIDQLEGNIKPAAFVFNSPNKCSAILQVNRAIVRRGERRLIALAKRQKVQFHILSYFNRLSDFIFLLARNS